MKKSISIILATAMVVSATSMINVQGADNVTGDREKKVSLASGIEWTNSWYHDYSEYTPGKMQNINIVVGDLNNPNVGWTTTKSGNSTAGDVVIAQEGIPSQANRKIANGVNIVAGITGDMSSTVTGIPMGINIEDGNLLINHNQQGQAKTFSSLYVDSNGKTDIGEVYFTGTATIDGTVKTLQSLNRNEFCENKLTIFTPIINTTATLKWYVEGSNYKFYENGAYAVIKITGSNPKQIKGGQTYSGKISKVIKQTTIDDKIKIANDEVVLTGFGSTAEYVRSLSEGKNISFKYNVYANGSINNNIIQAVSGYNWLVDNGKALTEAEMVARGNTDVNKLKQANAMTGVGITADNKMVFITIDKVGPNYKKSTGTTLLKLAEIMADLGCVKALGMDSGGSTEMYVRHPGTTKVVSANYPSDGGSRGLTNSFALVNKKPVNSGNSLANLHINQNPVMMANGAYKFTATGTDNNLNPVTMDNKTITWTATEGTIDVNGNYTAPNKSGTFTITATVDSVSTSTLVRVVETPESFIMSTSSVSLNPSDEKQLNVSASDGYDSVLIDYSAINWSIKEGNQYCTLSDKGVVKINSDVEKAKIVIEAKFGSKTVEAVIYIGLKNKMIDSFENENNDIYNANLAYNSSWDVKPSTKISGIGNGALDYTFNYTGWNTNYNAGMTITFDDYSNTNEKYLTDVTPRQIGMWIYSDGTNYLPWTMLYIRYGESSTQVTPTLQTTDDNGNVVSSSNMKWKGWKYFFVNIPSSYVAPVRLYAIYPVDTNKNQAGREQNTTFYFDGLQFVFEDEPIGLDSNASAAKKVADDIKKLDKTITLGDMSLINGIRTGYNKLSEKYTLQVYNYYMLVSAEKALEKLQSNSDNNSSGGNNSDDNSSTGDNLPLAATLYLIIITCGFITFLLKKQIKEIK